MNPLDDTVCVDSIQKVMDIFGGKWTFIIMGELHSGEKHFNELVKKLGISTKSLSNVLRKLEANDIILRTVLPTTPVTVAYSLTEKGKDFEEIFVKMKDWGNKWF